MAYNYNLEKVNADLYDDIDQLALDASGMFEQKLQELGIALPDDELEQLYDSMRTLALNLVDQ
jgi:hypothetical protein